MLLPFSFFLSTCLLCIRPSPKRIGSLSQHLSVTLPSDRSSAYVPIIRDTFSLNEQNALQLIHDPLPRISLLQFPCLHYKYSTSVQLKKILLISKFRNHTLFFLSYFFFANIVCLFQFRMVVAIQN
jgi:hypothetical protein